MLKIRKILNPLAQVRGLHINGEVRELTVKNVIFHVLLQSTVQSRCKRTVSGVVSVILSGLKVQTFYFWFHLSDGFFGLKFTVWFHRVQPFFY